MKNLPLGVQHFDKLIERGYLYVDKTQLICQLLGQYQSVFLARPRRFGKSLLLSTIAQLYAGRKDLFAGLWAEEHWDWSTTHPVLHFYMDQIDFAAKGVQRALLDELYNLGRKFEIKLEEEQPGSRLRELIEKVRQKTGKRVVVLFDEYDKPLLDVLHKPEEAEENRRLLSDFYSILKPIGNNIQFLMFTGISKFSHVSVFSKLNQLKDITFNEDYVVLTGYTQDELESNFEEYLRKAQEKLKMDRQALLSQIKHWYNGYTWDWTLKQYVYNPVSAMNFFADREFKNHWFATGTPEFLIQQMKNRALFNVELTEVSELAFESYTLQNMEITMLLFQTGYLTLRERKPGNIFRLDFPNHEVRQALTDHLMSAYGHIPVSLPGPHVIKLRDAFYRNDIDQAISIVNTLFENIPGTLARKKVEADYHAMLYLVFRYMGLDADAEVSGLRGRSDAVLKTPACIYVIEFKLDQSAQAAVDYIRTQGYAEKYRHDGRPVVLLGIGFSRKKRAVADWKTVPL